MPGTALKLGNQPLVPIVQEDGRGPELIQVFSRREKSLDSARNQTLDYPAHSTLIILTAPSSVTE